MAVEDPLDRKGLFFVVDWDERTLGARHDKLRSAVKEFNVLVEAREFAGLDYHFSVVEIGYPSHDNGLPAYCKLSRKIKLEK